MAGLILVISHGEDLHALEVLRHLQRAGADAVLFDTGRIPSEIGLTLAHDPAAGWSGESQVGGRTLDFRAVRAVWWRRPRPFSLDPRIGGADDRGFALAETHAAVAGLWSLLDARWVNDPDCDDKAGRKAWQLKIAREVGLTIPRTCITSDPDKVRGFIKEAGGPVIYKAFSATERMWRETRVLRPEEAQGLDAVRLAPVIFQSYVPARVDMRVIVVGDEVFAAEIEVPAGGYAHDFRVAMEAAEIRPHPLPAQVAGGLRALLRRLGLVYGAIDLRQTPAGEYVFLEINPAGQWLFIEQRTGQPISQAIAAQLALQ